VLRARRLAGLLAFGCIVPPMLAGVEGVNDASFAPQPLGPGARALAMGGAFAALADDLSAPLWNPAGLAQLEEAEFGAAGTWRRHRVGEEDDDEFELDSLGIAVPLRGFLVPQTVALTWHRAYSLGGSTSHRSMDVSNTPPTSAERDRATSIEQSGHISRVDLSYAVEPAPGLRFGISVGGWADQLTRASHWSAQGTLDETNTVFFSGTPILITETEQTSLRKTEVADGWSLTLGSMWQPLPEWRFALVYRPRFEFDVRSERHQTTVVNGGSPSFNNTDNQQEWQLPTTVTLGTAWRPDDLLTVDLDLIWTRWREQIVDARGADEHHMLAIGLEPDAADDGWAVHLGAEYALVRPRAVYALRAGAFWEQIPALREQPLTDSLDDVAFEFDDRYGVAIGVSLFHRRVVYDLGIQHAWTDDAGTGQETAIDSSVDIRETVARFAVTVLLP